MAIYEWPAVLPAPTSALQASVAPDTVRSTLERGATKQRGVFTTDSTFFTVTWDFTDNERKAFRAILKHELTNGADRFTIELPAHVGFTPVTARIVNGQYSESYRGVLHWTISATLECRDVPIFSDEVFDVLFFFAGEGFALEELETATQNAYDFYNVTLPLTLPR